VLARVERRNWDRTDYVVTKCRYLAKNGENRVNGGTVTFTDGTELFVADRIRMSCHRKAETGRGSISTPGRKAAIVTKSLVFMGQGGDTGEFVALALS